MSCYINKKKYNYLSSKTSGGERFFAFQDTRTKPETVLSLIRKLLSKNDNNVKRRPYQMFMTFSRKGSSKPDLDGSLMHDYIEMVKSIFKPFINGYGKFDKNVDYSKELYNIRFKISRHLRRITNCNDVNVVFKQPTASFMDEEITFYINDSSSINNEDIAYNIDNIGLKLSNTSSITVSIPIRYIKSAITKAYYFCVSEFNKNNVKLMDMDPRLASAVLDRVILNGSKRIYKALFAAFYKEFIFINFGRDTINSAINLIKFKGDYNKFDTSMIEGSRYNNDTLTFPVLERMIKGEGIDKLNPHLFLDMFEIREMEINSFITNFIRDSSPDSYPVLPPKYSDLHLEYNDYMDEESAITSGLVFVTKLNYCIIALMLSTKNSIKESTRSSYCEMISRGLSHVKTRSKISYVTNNKDLLIKEVERQLYIMNALASDIIKMKRFVERGN